MPKAYFVLLFLTNCCLARGPEQIIGYLFPKDDVLNPADIKVEELTRINYAFANLKDGRVVEGFAHDRENFAVLNGLKARNPRLKVLGFGWRLDLVGRFLRRFTGQKEPQDIHRKRCRLCRQIQPGWSRHRLGISRIAAKAGVCTVAFTSPWQRVRTPTLSLTPSWERSRMK